MLNLLSFKAAFAGMAELADALDSGSSVRKDMQVQVLFSAPRILLNTKSLEVNGQGIFNFEDCLKSAQFVCVTNT